MAQYGYLDVLTEAQAIRVARPGNQTYKLTAEEQTRYARGAAISDALVWLGHNVVLHPAAVQRTATAAPYQLTVAEQARYARAETIADALLWVWGVIKAAYAPIQRWSDTAAVEAE